MGRGQIQELELFLARWAMGYRATLNVSNAMKALYGKHYTQGLVGILYGGDAESASFQGLYE
jgi:hypothetical protein